MSGVTWTCQHCGKVNTIMCGSPPFCSCPEDMAELEKEVNERVRLRKEAEEKRNEDL